MKQYTPTLIKKLHQSLKHGDVEGIATDLNHATRNPLQGK